jgi:hypothetical protein
MSTHVKHAGSFFALQLFSIEGETINSLFNTPGLAQRFIPLRQQIDDCAACRSVVAHHHALPNQRLLFFLKRFCSSNRRSGTLELNLH